MDKNAGEVDSHLQAVAVADKLPVGEDRRVEGCMFLDGDHFQYHSGPLELLGSAVEDLEFEQR